MNRISASCASLLLAMSGACSGDPSSTNPFRASHTGIVSGRVQFTDGTPIDSAVVVVSVQPKPLYGYTTQPVASNARGEYSYLIERLAAPARVPSPDTARAEVVVSLLAARYRLPGNVVPTLYDTVVVTFLPSGQTPPATTSNFIFQR
jgi:hypothetical protein